MNYVYIIIGTYYHEADDVLAVVSSEYKANQIKYEKEETTGYDEIRIEKWEVDK